MMMMMMMMMTMLITFISEARFPHCDELKNVSFNRLRKYCMYWHCLHSMRASAVCPSVRLSVCPSLWARWPGDRLLHDWRAGGQQQRRRSPQHGAQQQMPGVPRCQLLA